MPKVAKEYEKVVRGHIRRLLIMDGGMTNVELVKQLQKVGIPFGLEYVAKLRQKIIKEKLQDRKSWILNDYLHHFIETLSEADRRLWQIATDSSVPEKTRVSALKEIRENKKAVFDKLFEAGIFQKELGNLNLRSFADIVREATVVHDTTATDKGIREGDRALAERPGSGDPGDLGPRLIDMVRAATDPESDTAPQENSGA